MVDERAFLKEPLHMAEELCVVYPPSIREVAREPRFGFFRDFLTRSQDDLEDLYKKKKIEGEPPTPLETILGFSLMGAQNLTIMEDAFKFFIHEPITFVYDSKAILIGELDGELKKGSVEQLRFLKEENFNDFQNLIRLSLGLDIFEPYVPEPNEDPRKTRMKKLARYRDRIAKKNKQGNGEPLNFSASLVSLCCMDFGLNPLTVGEISYAAMAPLIRYYQEKRKYETDISTLLAGGDSKKIKPKDWIRNIE